MAVRRARRQTQAQAARNLASIKKRDELEKKLMLRKRLASAVQNAAIQVMNGLAEAGPAWTGEFSASWGFAPAGTTPSTPGTTGKIYRYTKKDVPLRDVEFYLKNGIERFNIINTSRHAAIAIDEEDSMFAPPSYQMYPIGDVVKFGTGRPSGDHLRWQIRYEPGEDITSQITAPKDWFPTYVKAGKLERDLQLGVSFGLKDVAP